MSERATILGAGVGFVLAAIGAFAVDAYTSHHERIAEAEREARKTAALAAEQVRQLFWTADQTLRAAAFAYTAWREAPSPEPEQGHAMLRSIQIGSELLRRIGWIDARGELVVSSVSHPPPRQNVRDQPSFRDHADHHTIGMIVNEPVKGRRTGEWVGLISRRVDDRAGNFAGTVGGVLNTDFLGAVLEPYALGNQINLVLYTRSGAYMARYPASTVRLGTPSGNRDLFDVHLPRAERGSYHKASTSSGEDRIYSYHAVPGYPLVINASMTRATVLAPWLGRVQVTGGIAFLAIVLGVFATWLVDRQTQRLRREQRAAYEARFAAEHANRSKSEFLAHMSHEMRTPLNAVLGFSELMSKEVFGPIGSPRYRDYLKDISTSGQHLLQVINNILDLAKVEAGKWAMEEETVDPAKVAAVVAGMLSERARAAGVGIDIDAAAPPAELRADSRLIRQILLNLLANATKFSERGSRVAVSWRIAADGRFALSVSDRGSGIGAEDLKRIFEPFNHANAHVARPHTGTGLGLPLCKRFAEMHAGHLTIESAVGRGTVCTLWLPRERVLEAPRQAAAA